MSKATLILVPGGGHGPWVFSRLTPKLKSIQYNPIPVKLPCVGADPATPTLLDDVASIRAELDKALGRGEDVGLICHSYGAVEGTAALEGLERTRQEGRGRLLGILMISGFLLSKGTKLDNGPRPPFVKVDNGKHEIEPSFVKSMMFNDMLFDPEVDDLVSQNTWTTEGAYATPVPYSLVADPDDRTPLNHPVTYVMTTNDAVLSLAQQESFVGMLTRGNGGKGKDGKMMSVEKIDSGHLAMLSRPDELADIIDRTFERYASMGSA